MPPEKQVEPRDFISLTKLLNQHNRGDTEAFPQIVRRAYKRIRAIAAKKLRKRFDQPLRSLTNVPTSIADDIIADLEKQYTEWRNTRHFFAIASRIAFRIVRDYKRHRNAKQRGSGNRGIRDDLLLASLPASLAESRARALKESGALEALAKEHPRVAEVVTLRYPGKNSVSDIAEMIDSTPDEVRADLKFALIWLQDYFATRE